MDNAGYEWRYVLNLGNAMLGVPMLAMPYCFERCGWLLGIILLIFSAYLSIKSSLLLWRISLITQPGSYEMAAEAIYGSSGKALICICIIAFNFGITVASFVIIGDYMSQPAQYLLTLDNPNKKMMIIFVGILVILPLSLIRRIDKFYYASIASICAYGMLIVYLTLEFGYYVNDILSSLLFNDIKMWDMWGALECIPIILSGFACQTQMLILYETIPDTRKSCEDVKPLLDKAIYLVCTIYCIVGFFGYITLYRSGEIQSDLLNNLNSSPDITRQLLTFAFCCSLTVSFPMIVFPFRTCVYSLLSARPTLTHVQYIPENHFFIITTVIVISSMVLGMLIPDISVILTFSGGYSGTLLCFVFPALMFLKRSTPQEDITGAKIILVFGLISTLTSSMVLLHKAYDIPPLLHVVPEEPQLNWVTIPDMEGRFHNDTENIVNNIAQKQVLVEKLDIEADNDAHSDDDNKQNVQQDIANSGMKEVEDTDKRENILPNRAIVTQDLKKSDDKNVKVDINVKSIEDNIQDVDTKFEKFYQNNGKLNVTKRNKDANRKIKNKIKSKETILVNENNRHRNEP